MKSGFVIDHEIIAKAVAKELVVDMAGDLKRCKLLSLQQAADLLGVSKASVRALVPCIVDLGVQSPRVRLSDIEALIASRVRTS